MLKKYHNTYFDFYIFAQQKYMIFYPSNNNSICASNLKYLKKGIVLHPVYNKPAPTPLYAMTPSL